MAVNVLELLLNAFYRAAEGDPLAQRMIAGAAQTYNDRMAEINHQPPVPALRSANGKGK